MSNTQNLNADMVMAFASPILRLQVANASTLNPKLIKETKALQENSPGIRRSNRQGWHSDTDLMNRSEPGFSELSQFIKKIFKSATKVISPSFNPSNFHLQVDGWVNVNPPHGYNVPHRHDGFMWSGCYYVAVPKSEHGASVGSGNIEFLSPLTVPGDYRAMGAMCFEEKIVVSPNAGDMLLFPSYLTHLVSPNETDEERITIAFNGKFVPREPA